jgi:hypothetical protein
MLAWMRYKEVLPFDRPSIPILPWQWFKAGKQARMKIHQTADMNGRPG